MVAWCSDWLLWNACFSLHIFFCALLYAVWQPFNVYIEHTCPKWAILTDVFTPKEAFHLSLAWYMLYRSAVHPASLLALQSAWSYNSSTRYLINCFWCNEYELLRCISVLDILTNHSARITLMTSNISTAVIANIHVVEMSRALQCGSIARLSGLPLRVALPYVQQDTYTSDLFCDIFVIYEV